MNRFLIPKYIFNSVRIKLKTMNLRRKHGKYPYDHLKNNVEYSDLPKYELSYLDRYHSFEYFDLTKATKHYKGKKLFIIDIMMALIEYNEMLTKGDIDSQALILHATKISKQAKYIDGLPHFRVQEDFPKFDIKGKVTSGIIQAKASSFFLRVYTATDDPKYLGWSKSVILTCIKPRNEGGIMIKSDISKSWVEEYDTDKPSMVLNGFVFVLIAAAEYLSFEDNYEIRTFFENGIKTLFAWLPQFQQGNDIMYSMYHWDLANVNYWGVMKYQFEHLNKITNIKELEPIIELLRENKNMSTFHKMMGV